MKRANVRWAYFVQNNTKRFQHYKHYNISITQINYHGRVFSHGNRLLRPCTVLPRIERHCLAPHQKYNVDKLEMVQRKVARFVKGRYGMYESVTQMLEELTWVPLSKRRENARLILFYKIINNLAMVTNSCLEKAHGRTRKKHNLKFWHIGCNVDPYGQPFFPKCISVWNGLA